MESHLRYWAEHKYGKEKVIARIDELLGKMKTHNAQTLRTQLITDSTVKRLEQLRQENKNIEYIIVASALVESGMQRLITSYEFVINGILSLNDFNTPLSIRVHAQNDNNAFGNLVNELNRFSKNEKLLGLLSNFNQFKKKVGHKMFEKETNIDKVNEDLEAYVKTEPIVKIHNEMVAENDLIQERLVDRLKEYGLIY